MLNEKEYNQVITGVGISSYQQGGIDFVKMNDLKKLLRQFTSFSEVVVAEKDAPNNEDKYDGDDDWEYEDDDEDDEYDEDDVDDVDDEDDVDLDGETVKKTPPLKKTKKRGRPKLTTNQKKKQRDERRVIILRLLPDMRKNPELVSGLKYHELLALASMLGHARPMRLGKTPRIMKWCKENIKNNLAKLY